MGFWQILSIPQPSLGKGQLWPWGRKSRARLGFSIAATRRSYGSSGWNGLRWKWCNLYWNFWAAFSRFIYLFFPFKAVYYESTEKYTGNVGTEVLKIVWIDKIFTLWCCFRNAQIMLMVTKLFCDYFWKQPYNHCRYARSNYQLCCMSPVKYTAQYYAVPYSCTAPEMSLATRMWRKMWSLVLRCTHIVLFLLDKKYG